MSVLDTALISGATVALRCTYDLAGLQRRDFVMLSTFIEFFRPQMIIWRCISSPWADIQKRHVNFFVSGDTQVTLASKPFREGEHFFDDRIKGAGAESLTRSPFHSSYKDYPPSPPPPLECSCLLLSFPTLALRSQSSILPVVDYDQAPCLFCFPRQRKKESLIVV